MRAKTFIGREIPSGYGDKTYAGWDLCTSLEGKYYDISPPHGRRYVSASRMRRDVRLPGSPTCSLCETLAFIGGLRIKFTLTVSIID